jgi:DNA-binding response OmpR family regulator
MATVLVVDCDLSTRINVTELLRAGGYGVRAVADRVVGIDCPGRILPSAVLLSLQPDGSSTQKLCMALRQFVPAVPVIVVGPDIDVGTKVALFELGADDYMVRPFDTAEMLARLRAAIRRSQWICGRN